MTIMDAVTRELDGVVDYLLMLSEYSGQPADFLTVKNGKRYALMLREIPDKEQTPQGEERQERPDDPELSVS